MNSTGQIRYTATTLLKLRKRKLIRDRNIYESQKRNSKANYTYDTQATRDDAASPMKTRKKNRLLLRHKYNCMERLFYGNNKNNNDNHSEFNGHETLLSGIHK